MGDIGVIGAWLLLAVVVVGAIGFAVGSVLLARRMMDTQPEHNSVLSPFLTVAMPQPEQAQVRGQLRKYAAAVQGPEWGKDEFGDISNNGRAALTQLYRIVGTETPGAAVPPIDQQFLSELTVLASDRSARILDSQRRIPRLLWCALIFGGLVLIMLTSFMRLAINRFHLVLVSAVTVLLALLLYVIFALDHPFGPAGVTPQPFSHAVEVFDLVDRGT